MLKLKNTLFFMLFATCISSCVGFRQAELERRGQEGNVIAEANIAQRVQRLRASTMRNLRDDCGYSHFLESGMAQRLIDPQQFELAYQTIAELRKADYVFQTPAGRAYARPSLRMQKRMQQILDARLARRGQSRPSKDGVRQTNDSIAKALAIPPVPIDEALIEHETREKVWIDTAILRVEQLENNDANYQALANFDTDKLDGYATFCTLWRPQYLEHNGPFPMTNEPLAIERLRKAMEAKMYAILTSGLSAIPEQLNRIKNESDASQFSTQYIFGSEVSKQALTKAGLYDTYLQKVMDGRAQSDMVENQKRLAIEQTIQAESRALKEAQAYRGPFSGRSAAYLNAIYHDNQAAIRGMDKQVVVTFKKVMLKEGNPYDAIFSLLSGGLVSPQEMNEIRADSYDRISFTLPLVMVYILNYEHIYPQCMDSNPQIYNVKTISETVYKNSLGFETSRNSTVIEEHYLHINQRFVQIFEQLKRDNMPEDPSLSALFLDSFFKNPEVIGVSELFSNLRQAMKGNDCKSRTMQNFESNLIKTYVLINNDQLDGLKKGLQRFFKKK